MNDTVERREVFARTVADRFDDAPIVGADGLPELQARLHQAANLVNARLAQLGPPVDRIKTAKGRSFEQIQTEAEAVSLRHDETLRILREALSDIDRVREWADHVADGLARLPASTPRLNSVRKFAEDLIRLLATSRAAVVSRRDFEHDLAENVGRLSITLGLELSRGLIAPAEDGAAPRATANR